MKKLRAMRKAMAWLVCAVLACSMLPAAAFADGGGIAAGSASGESRLARQGDSSAGPTTQGALASQSSGKPSVVFTRALSTPLVLKLGSTYSLGTKASSGAKVTYFSAAPERVSVSKKGVLQARSTGVAVVAATAKTSSGKTTKKVRVRVVDASGFESVKSIEAKIGVKTLHIGQSAEIETTFSPAAASNKNLVYKSLTPKVASVSADGKVKAKAAGTAKVRVASAENPRATRTVKFKVTAKVAPKLKNYSWAQLKKISKKIASAKSDAAGLKIAKKYGLVNASGKLTGARKSLKLIDGTKAYVRILGFRHDKLASGGLSGISFEFANVPDRHEMDGDGSNEGGWALSDMRSWLNSDFYKKLPKDLRKCIARAEKRTNNLGEVDDESGKGMVSTTRDKLWLLSATEVYGDMSGWSYADVYNAEGSQYKLYSDKKVTTDRYSFCEKKGASSWWWLRSPNAYISDGFRGVYSNGDWVGDSADYANGVSPGFCF